MAINTDTIAAIYTCDAKDCGKRQLAEIDSEGNEILPSGWISMDLLVNGRHGVFAGYVVVCGATHIRPAVTAVIKSAATPTPNADADEPVAEDDDYDALGIQA